MKWLVCSPFVVLLLVPSFTPIIAQFDDVKGCLQSLEIPDIANCVVGKFVDLADSIRAINRSELPIPPFNRSSLPIPFTPGGLYVTSLHDIIDSLFINNERLKTSLPKEARGAGADSFLLKVYFSKLQRDTENTKQRHHDRKYKLPSLLDIFEDLLALMKISDNVEHNAKQGDGIQATLVHSQRSILETHTKQLMIGRVLPALEQILGPRLLAMENELLTSDENELFMTSADALEELLRLAKCLKARNEEDFEDGLTWTRCLFTCKDLPLLSTCVVDLMNSKPSCKPVPWIGDILLRLFTDYMELGHCFFDIVSTPQSLTEGGSTEFADIRFFMPPSVHCFTPDLLNNGLRQQIIDRVFKVTTLCDVMVHVTTSNYMYDLIPYIPRLDVSMPRCRNRTSINQIAIGWHEHALNASGIIPLTMDNWNSTFRLPLTAVIDHKVEQPINFRPIIIPGAWNVSTELTLKFHVDGTRVNTTKVPITVIDRDIPSPVTCHSVNDPHILTFDQTYYNNFYHGYFQFYKHDSLPYEVQVAYQACSVNTKQSCTCAVAVRSGDDVFVVDKCRLHANHCSEADETCRLMRVALYLNGELTPGTRVYRLHGGLGYQIVLPHGGILRVKTNGDMLNVWFTPSLYDRDHSKGLCGFYNGRSNDDYRYPNGTTCTPTRFTQCDEREFSKSWRLNYTDTIFNGAHPMSVDESFMSSNFCRCSHIIRVGIRCVCGYDLLVDTCDLDLGNEFTEWNISALFHPSQKSNTTDVDQRDFDLTYEPPALPSWTNTSEKDAKARCKEIIGNSTNAFISMFTRNSSQPYSLPDKFEQMCMEDIQIVSYPISDWEYSAIEAAKVWSRDRIDRATIYTQNMIQNLENDTCINECYGRGTCVQGTCHCDSPYGGPDCRDWESRPVVVMPTWTLCDARYQNCSFITVYGQRFVDNSSLTCSLESREMLEEYEDTQLLKDVDIMFISPSQIACLAHTFMTSYHVTLKHDGQVLDRESFIVTAYDSVCYTCDSSRQFCDLKRDGSYCYIGGMCYANAQHSSIDECMLCNTTVSTGSLSESQDPVCIQRRLDEKTERDRKKKEDNIRIIVSVSSSVVIVIITFIAFIVNTRNEKKKKEMEQNSDKNTSSFSESDVTSAISKTVGEVNKEDTNGGVSHTYAIPSFELSPSDDTDKENNSSVAAADDKPWDRSSMTSDVLRSRNNSITSARSAGIGGVGSTGDDGQSSSAQMNYVKL